MTKTSIGEMVAFLLEAERGKIIQTRIGRERWQDTPFPAFMYYASDQIRVKPEPRECWRNQFDNGSLSEILYETREQARDSAHISNRGWQQICFREVLED